MNDRREIMTRLEVAHIMSKTNPVTFFIKERVDSIIEYTPDEPPATPSEPSPLAQDVDEAMDNLSRATRSEKLGMRTTMYGQESADNSLDTIRRALEDGKLCRELYEHNRKSLTDKILETTQLAQDVEAFGYEKYIEDRMKPLESLATARKERIDELVTELEAQNKAPLAQEVEDAIKDFVWASTCLKDDTRSMNDEEIQEREATIRRALDAKTSVPDEVMLIIEGCFNCSYAHVSDKDRNLMQDWLDQKRGE